MVTVRNSEHDKVVALDSGADDYVVKPFAIGELLARIRAALRRSTSEEPLRKIETPELSVDLEKRMIDVRGERVHLNPKEFDVLRLLVIQQGKPLTHKRVLQVVWGPDHAEQTENLRVVINQLRKKIEKDPPHPRYILTEPWLGYLFQFPSITSEKRPPRKSLPLSCRMKTVEIQIQLQNIHAGFAKESQVAALRMSLDKRAHVCFFYAARMSNAVNLEFRSGGRDIRV
jgi:DNA-binding winged helix-turn-helix (wHTH) protein